VAENASVIYLVLYLLPGLVWLLLALADPGSAIRE